MHELGKKWGSVGTFVCLHVHTFDFGKHETVTNFGLDLSYKILCEHLVNIYTRRRRNDGGAETSITASKRSSKLKRRKAYYKEKKEVGYILLNKKKVE